MKKVFIILAILCIGAKGFSQQDSSQSKKESHWKKWEQMHKEEMEHWEKMDSTEWHGHHPWPMPPHHWGNNHVKPANLSTNWLIIDLGFTNYNDKTNYASATAQAFAPGGNSNWFNLKNNKSVDVNIWLFMQRLSLYKGIVNLKYGFGMQMYNYFYKTNVVYVDGANPYVIRDTISYSKNKLATDYFTVPLMVNINTNPSRGNRALNFSFGVSAGYMYSSRQKLKVGDDKNKHKSNFNLEPWKVDYVAEVGLGIVHLYGSYNITALHKNAIQQYPYAVGIRIGGWDD